MKHQLYLDALAILEQEALTNGVSQELRNQYWELTNDIRIKMTRDN